MHAIENLNPGDAIVTQTTKHAETYKLHRYTPYTITGVSDGVAILNNGTHALMHTPEKESVYTLQELTTSYNQRTHVCTPYMTEAITWQVDIIKTFTGDTAKDEAHNHSALLNKARTLLKGVAGVSDLQRKPHTITSNMVEEVVALAGKHIQQGVKSALETLAFIRDGLNELVAADVKMRAKYNAPSAASGKLYILTNKDGEATSYGFQEGAIVEIETRHNIHTLQVHGGDNTAIHLINDTGKARYATARDIEKYSGGKKFYGSGRCIYVHDPRGVVFPETFGANSLTILLNRKYDVEEWGGKLVQWWDHSTILGKSGFKTASFSGTNRPHNPDGHDRDIEEMVHALTWHVNSLDNSNAPALKESTIPMYVDFSKGDGWAFDSFLYRESRYYHFKDKDPAEYLSRKGRVQATFVAKDVAVVTSVTGADRRVPAPFIVLSAAKPMSQDLTGHSYTIESVKPGGEWEPAMITFKR